MSNRYGLQIRAATAEDAAGVAELLAAAGRRVPAADLARSLEALRRGAGTVLVALEWGPPSGLIALGWLPTLDGAAPVALVTALVVAPDDRRRGIGRLLLKAGSQAARAAGCDEIRLLAPPGDDTLPRFCDATGFRRDAVLWARALRKKG